MLDKVEGKEGCLKLSFDFYTCIMAKHVHPPPLTYMHTHKIDSRFAFLLLQHLWVSPFSHPSPFPSPHLRLELAMETRLALKSQTSFCLCLPSAKCWDQAHALPCPEHFLMWISSLCMDIQVCMHNRRLSWTLMFRNRPHLPFSCWLQPVLPEGELCLSFAVALITSVSHNFSCL